MTEKNRYLESIEKVLREADVHNKIIGEMMREFSFTGETANGDNSKQDKYIGQKLAAMIKTKDPFGLFDEGGHEFPSQTPIIGIFTGPAGCGKTTTIAKIAANLTLKHRKKVALFSSDVYQAGSTEKLKSYGNIIEVPVEILYKHSEIISRLDKYKDYSVILLDTDCEYEIDDKNYGLKNYIDELENFKTHVFLNIPANVKFDDMQNIVESHMCLHFNSIIATKMDETSSPGTIFSIAAMNGISLSYLTNGQQIPDHLAAVNSDYFVQKILFKTDKKDYNSRSKLTSNINNVLSVLDRLRHCIQKYGSKNDRLVAKIKDLETEFLER